MKRRSVALRGFAALLLPLLARQLPAEEIAPHPENAAAIAKFDAIAKAYSIELVTASPAFPVQLAEGQIRGRAAANEKLVTYVPIFAKEFALYPVDFVKRSHLKRIVFCEELAWDDQLRASIPDFANDTLYIDVVRGDWRENYQRKVLHHEFFHMVDQVDDGLLYRDDRWSAANPAEFRYGAGGDTAQTTEGTGALSDKYPGFLNHYSTTGVEEDKAEIFAYLFIDRAELARRAETDGVLRAKVELMKRLLQEFCPEMTAERWEPSLAERPASVSGEPRP